MSHKCAGRPPKLRAHSQALETTTSTELKRRNAPLKARSIALIYTVKFGLR